jgi:hypothetical protein
MGKFSPSRRSWLTNFINCLVNLLINKGS